MTHALLLALLALAPGDVTVFDDVRVVTLGPAGTLERGVVVVEGDRIRAVGTPDEVELPDDARRVPGHGFTLVPGLIDLHVHVGDEVDLDLYVAHGVTTVRDLGGGLWHLGVRDRVASGRRLGPTLHLAGPKVTGVHDAEAARALVAEQAERGFTWLKIYGDIAPDAYGALVGAARELGMRPCGHVPRNLTVEQVLETPPDSIDHAEEFLYGWFDGGRHGRGSIPELAELVAASGTSVVATLTCYDHIGRQAASFERAFDRGPVRYASAYSRRTWGPDENRYRGFPPDAVPQLRDLLVLQKDFLRAFHEAGVPLLLGTDSGGDGVPFMIPGASAHDELPQLVACGLTAEEALAAGTREAARLLGVLDEVGTIEAGKRADLLLVKGDPLADPTNTTLRAGVMVRGRWLPEAELDGMLARIAEQSRREEAFLVALRDGGPEAAAALLASSLADDPSLVPFREDSLNELAYEALILDDRPDTAVELFRLNAEAYPESWSVHDSLGEGLRATGRLEEALAAYEESVRLEPRHVDGARCVAELRAELGPGREER